MQFHMSRHVHIRVSIRVRGLHLVFFRVKWLQPAMKGTSCVRQVRLWGRFGSFSVFCNEWLFLCA